MSNKRALVTGGCGFIGSHLVDELIQRGFEVFVIDNLSSGNLNNVKHQFANDSFHLIKGDVIMIKELLGDVKDIDIVFHEAAISSVTKSVTHPSSVFDSNVISSLNLLEYCRNSGIQKIVFASSSAVYGDSSAQALSEDNLCSPISPYGASKIATEYFLQSYWKTYGLKTVSLRYFNVYGNRQNYSEYSGVITIFINRLLKEDPLLIYGDGKQVRDFVNIKDVVKANLLAMDSENAVGESINVGTGTQTTILELGKHIQTIVGGKSKSFIFRAMRQGDIQRSVASTIKARLLLGFIPSISLNKGLEDYIKNN